MISTVCMFEIHMVVVNHMQTQYKYVWELAFYGKLQEVIFIQLSLWNDISFLKRVWMKPKSTCRYM